ncbi:MAG: endolytic transglycosylase MltG [Acidimicrobiales bacterium]
MRRRTIRVVAGVGAVIFLFVVWFALQAHPLGGPGRLVVVTVKPGDSISTIAGEMHAQGVIASPFAFRLDTELFGSLTVSPGAYQIAQNSSFAHVRAVFGAPPNVNVIDVTPGVTLHEVFLTLVADRGSRYADDFLGAAAAMARTSPYHPNLDPPFVSGREQNVSALEGLVGVGTYLLTPHESALSLATAMTAGFVTEAASVGFSPSTTVNGLSAYQLVIAASIVEREGYYPQNMPRVARVIFNRLHRGGPLQMDSTVKYPLGLDAGAVTSAMLQTATPYNTYLHVGLTPTPICAVSATALKAVLHAPPGPWLYFVVVDRRGNEAFATTYAQQLVNERRAARVLG